MQFKRNIMSVNCGMCGWPGGGHEDACPEKHPEDKELLSQWGAGFATGEAGQELPHDQSDTFLLGYRAGRHNLETERWRKEYERKHLLSSEDFKKVRDGSN
jgi:hypothetical protein